MNALDFRRILGAVVGALACALVVATPAAANIHSVDDTADEPDATPGDSVCATAGGSCTLRAAFMESEASEHAAVDEILLPAGVYRLTRPHTPRPVPSSTDGDLRIGVGPVMLLGDGPEVTIIEQTVEDRVLRVHRGAAEIVGVTLRGGRALSDEAEGDFGFALPRNWGGGILADSGSSLTLRSVVVTDNEASGPGGGVMSFIQVPVVLQNVEITDNRAGETGGGLSVTFAELDMAFSTVSGNQANECGGIAVGVQQGLEFNDVHFPIRIRRSRVTGNDALGAAGVIGGQIWPGLAGGICVFSARNEFQAFGGDFALEDTLVQGNVGGGGGGLYHRGVAGMDVIRSTFVGNNAYDGGGLLILGSGRILNTTVSGNTTNYRGGGIDHDKLLSGFIDGSGGFRSAPSNLSLQFSTITENRGGSALFTSHVSNGTQLIGTILANRRAANCNIAMDSIGSNVDSDGTCLSVPGPGDQSGVDPELMSLADNGGATPTHALQPTSPAIDAHVLAGGCPATDQRLALRPAGAACDAGAYEVDAAPLGVPGEPPLAPGEVGGGSVRLVLSGGVIQALSAQGSAIEPIEPADGKGSTWFLPSVGGYLGETRVLLVQRGGLDFTRGKRRFETADWVVRVGPNGGKVVSYAGEYPRPPFWARFASFFSAKLKRGPVFAPRFRAPPRWARRFRQPPLELFDLEPVGQAPNLLVARLTERAAHRLNRELKVRSFKPGMEFGTLLLEPEPVDPKNDPPGDPLPPPNG